MAIAIKNIPVLTGKDAERFIKEADKNYTENNGKIDFKKEIETARKILSKAKL